MKLFKRILMLATLPVATALAGPGLINYQGRLTNSAGTPITTPTTVTFTLWDADTGGNQLDFGFTDSDVITPDDRGLYSTEVGDEGGAKISASVFDNDNVWLNVNIEGEDLAPRLRITSAGYAADADTLQGRDPAAFLNMASDAYIVVKTVPNPTLNGINLIAAYTAAKALTPGGNALSATNRAVVVVPPGQYDLGAASLTMDVNFVDLVGLTTNRDSQYISSSSDVLVQTAADVRIENLTLNSTEILRFAYKPVGGSPAATTIRNCVFKAINSPMLYAVEYAGTYIDCVGGLDAWGSSGWATGKFINCTGGAYSFGGYGIASGTFINCTGDYSSFGGEFGYASGTFTNCTAGANSFGGFGVASGTFKECTGGVQSFGAYGDASNGKFNYCIGGSDSFTEVGSPAPVQLFCIQNGGSYLGNN